MEFGKNLRTQREAHGMTQAELAEKLGVTRSLIAQYELGAKSPNIIFAQRIADFFGVKIDDLARKE